MTREERAARLAAIRSCLDGGCTRRVIAEHFGLSKQGLRAILRAAGVERGRPGRPRRGAQPVRPEVVELAAVFRSQLCG